MNPDSKDKKRNVVVTGASTGIGESCALHLDRLGFRVFAGVRKDEDGQALRDKSSDNLTPVILDVTNEDDIASASRIVTDAIGDIGLHGLVNNAGVAISGPLEFLEIDQLRRQLEINVIGQIAVTQAFMPLLRKATGRIVNMGSISGRIALPFLGPYAASKFALEALTDSMRMELMQWGIHVSIIEPGVIVTPIWEKSRKTVQTIIKGLSREARQKYFPAINAMGKSVDEAVKRGIPPEQVAKVVIHALTAKRPHTRYLVGKDAKLNARLCKFIPDRLWDKLVIRNLKLPM